LLLLVLMVVRWLFERTINFAQKNLSTDKLKQSNCGEARDKFAVESLIKSSDGGKDWNL